MVRFAFAAFFASALGGCFIASPTPPMRVMDHAPRGPEQAEGLVVFLPGFGDDGGVFDRYGLVAILEEETRFDALGAHAHFGFYREFSILPRLEADVIGPARRMGYERIWLVGTSMGGFGAVSYAATHPEEVAGVILMAPYLGEPAVLAEIREQGLTEWEPGNLAAMADDRARVTRRNWAWMRDQLRDPNGTPIYLGYGEQDSGVPEFRLLEAALPAERVVHIPGPHGWAAWTPIFDRLVDRAFEDERPAK